MRGKKKLLDLIMPEDYCPFLLFQFGTQGVVTRKLQNTKRKFMSFGKGSGVQEVFSLVLLVGDWDSGSGRRWNQLNGWCHTQGFGFYDLECTGRERLGVLTLDGTQLTGGTASFLDRLAEL